ncbi:hypothetical protein TNIN_488311, partial [Trichonephila inaurata madagascariensis]
MVDSVSFNHLDHLLQAYKILRNLVDDVDKS